MRPQTIPVDGSDLHVTLHPADEQRAVLLLVHGFGEHSGRYARQVEFLTSRGITTATYDLRGHGNSPGRGGRATVGRHVRDNLAVRDTIAERFHGVTGPGGEALPRLMLGHSMGGLIAAESAVRRPWILDGLVLSSPALVVGAETPAPLRAAAPVVARLLPFLPVETLDPNDISSIPEYVEDYRSDPLVHHSGVPASAAGTMLSGGRRMLARSRGLPMPTLLLAGDADAITSVEGARRFAVEAGSLHDPRPEITYREFPGGRHELFNDVCADEVYDVLGRWLDARLA